MTKKFTRLEAFQELSVKLAIIESKIDRLLEIEDRIKKLEEVSGLREKEPSHPIPLIPVAPPSFMDEYLKKLAQDQVNEREPKVVPKCLWDNLSPEDKMKPMGLSCPCPKCTPYCMNDAIISDLSSYCRDPENKNLNKGTIRISGDLDIQ